MVHITGYVCKLYIIILKSTLDINLMEAEYIQIEDLLKTILTYMKPFR